MGMSIWSGTGGTGIPEKSLLWLLDDIHANTIGNCRGFLSIITGSEANKVSREQAFAVFQVQTAMSQLG